MRNVSNEDLCQVEVVNSYWKFAKEEIEEYRRGDPIKFQPAKILVEAEWHDDLSRNCKAMLFLRLYRRDELIHTYDIFGVFKRDGSQTQKTISETEEISSLAQVGDQFAICGKTGGSDALFKS